MMKSSKPDTAETEAPSGKPKPVMLLVLGPHRSGTSLTARMLECLGGVNSKNLNPANEFNPKGYFEDWDTYQFNEYVLMPELRTSWHATSPIRWESLAPSRYEKLQTSALEIIRRNYNRQAPLSILKEPRIAHLLPFWLQVLQRAGFTVKAVCPVRDPLAVARSLAQRDGFPLASGFLIYYRAWEAVLTNLGKTPTFFFDFQDIFNSAAAALKKIAEHLCISIPADFDSRLDNFITSHLDSTLVHNASFQEDYDSLVHELPNGVTPLHQLLVQCCTTQHAAAARHHCVAVSSELQEIAAYLAALDELAVSQIKKTLAISELAAVNAALRTSLASSEEACANLRSSLASRDAARTEIESSLASSEQARTKLAIEHEAALQERFAELAALATRLSELDERIESLLASTSWRLTHPLRIFMDRAKALTKLLAKQS